MDRLAMLRQMAAAKPEDPFPTYGLAMELNKLGQTDEAKAAFTRLVEQHRSYVPTYLMYGNLLARMGEQTDAAKIYEQGIEVATEAGDDHARGELEAARAELP